MPTQDLAARFVEAGYVGLIVPSYARGATAGDVNVVLWQWNTRNADALTVVDGEEQLG